MTPNRTRRCDCGRYSNLAAHGPFCPGCNCRLEPPVAEQMPAGAKQRVRQSAPLPSEYECRKAMPIYDGCLAYFPMALLYLSHVSLVANEQHNPGEPLHWAREKSTDERNTLVRHLLEAGGQDTDRLRHSGKALWRAAANLEKELEAAGYTVSTIWQVVRDEAAQ